MIMGLFDFVTFNAEDVKAVHNGTATRSQLYAVVTSQTCGEACWHAHEDICRCSCGGKNHGCLRSKDGKQPERTCRIDGERYKLAGVGRYSDLFNDAKRINREAGWKAIEKPYLADNGGSCEPFWVQYRYHWSETDHGAPARLKTANPSQRNWNELSGWKDERTVYLLWQRVTMPPRPTELAIDTETGLPLADQNPN